MWLWVFVVLIVLSASFVAMLAWLAANWAGRHYGWPAEYAFLADLAAIGALVWSLLVTWRIWRRRDGAPRER